MIYLLLADRDVEIVADEPLQLAKLHGYEPTIDGQRKQLHVATPVPRERPLYGRVVSLRTLSSQARVRYPTVLCDPTLQRER